MNQLIAKEPRNAERIFPYIGGEEINGSPTHAHHRYVINFGQMTEEEARTWPDLMAIVETKVKPARLAQNREIRARYWWRFGEVAPALYEAIRGMDRCLANSQVSGKLSFAFQPTNRIFAHSLNVFAFCENGAFAILQSSSHEVWARFFGSSMKDDLRYTPSDCFETFPFPPDWENNKELEAIGKTYYEFRAALMIKNNEGLTKTYNRFHHPDEPSADIRQLRALHAQMDRAVLDAYGWTDIVPQYDFREQLDESIRYTWGEDTRDEVLARLLEANRVQAAKEAEEARRNEAPKATKKAGAKKKAATKDEGTMLFNLDEPGGKKA